MHMAAEDVIGVFHLSVSSCKYEISRICPLRRRLPGAKKIYQLDRNCDGSQSRFGFGIVQMTTVIGFLHADRRIGLVEVFPANGFQFTAAPVTRSNATMVWAFRPSRDSNCRACIGSVPTSSWPT